MKYGNLIVKELDKKFIDDLADKYDIDYYNADIGEEYGLVANQLIYYILSEAVNNLEISDDIKDYLQSKIYCNCIYSGFDISSEDVDDMIDGTNKEKKIVKQFLDLKK